jgi:hypothetical protein
MLATRVLDHVILGADHYYSFSDRGTCEGLDGGYIGCLLEFHRECEIENGRQPSCCAE